MSRPKMRRAELELRLRSLADKVMAAYDLANAPLPERDGLQTLGDRITFRCGQLEQTIRQLNDSAVSGMLALGDVVKVQS